MSFAFFPGTAVLSPVCVKISSLTFDHPAHKVALIPFAVFKIEAALSIGLLVAPFSRIAVSVCVFHGADALNLVVDERAGILVPVGENQLAFSLTQALFPGAQVLGPVCIKEDSLAVHPRILKLPGISGLAGKNISPEAVGTVAPDTGLTGGRVLKEKGQQQGETEFIVAGTGELAR